MASQEVDFKTPKPKKIFYIGLSVLIHEDNKNSIYRSTGSSLSQYINAKGVENRR